VRYEVGTNLKFHGNVHKEWNLLWERILTCGNS
jgi:hypothetical protein